MRADTDQLQYNKFSSNQNQKKTLHRCLWLDASFTPYYDVQDFLPNEEIISTVQVMLHYKLLFFGT
jgi:hypothetical protein